MFGRSRLIIIIYLVVGVIVAASKDYFDGIDNIEGVISAALGVVLWPLLLLDVNLRIGRLDDDGGRRRDGLLLVPALAHATRSVLVGLKDRAETYRGVNRTGLLSKSDPLFAKKEAPSDRNGPLSA
jgi:hypothetical protein